MNPELRLASLNEVAQGLRKRSSTPKQQPRAAPDAGYIDLLKGAAVIATCLGLAFLPLIIGTALYMWRGATGVAAGVILLLFSLCFGMRVADDWRSPVQALVNAVVDVFYFAAALGGSVTFVALFVGGPVLLAMFLAELLWRGWTTITPESMTRYRLFAGWIGLACAAGIAATLPHWLMAKTFPVWMGKRVEPL